MRFRAWQGVAVVLIACAAGAAGAAQWTLSLGAANGHVNGVARAADGGYGVAGTSMGAGPSTTWIVKLDANGRIAWQKLLSEGLARAIHATPDGGFVVAAYLCSPTSGECGPSVVKLDASGSIQWTRRYSNMNARVSSLRPTSDGGYIVAGGVSETRGIFTRGWLLKLDAAGTPAWQAAYGKPIPFAHFSFLDAEQAPDGGFVAVGAYREDAVALRQQALIMKIDTAGNLEWSRTFGTTGTSSAAAARFAADGSFLVGGHIEATTGAGAWVARLDAGGNVLWQRIYGSPGDTGNALESTADGGAVLVGRRVVVNPGTGGGQWDMWALKLDATGAVEWQRTYGGLLDEIAYGVQPAPDGGYVLAGTTRSFATVATDIWIVKIAADGALQGCPLAADSQATAAALVDPATTPSATSTVQSVRAFDFTLQETVATLQSSLQCMYADAVSTEVPALSPLLATLLAAMLGAVAAMTLALRGNDA